MVKRNSVSMRSTRGGDACDYSDRERAALEWTEAVTLISRDQVPDEIYEGVRKQFSEVELAMLTLAVASINSWNRIAISFRVVPGSYERPKHA